MSQPGSADLKIGNEKTLNSRLRELRFSNQRCILIFTKPLSKRVELTIMKKITTFCALLVSNSPAFAEAPQVPTDAPYIVLSDNHDEPNGYGFCIDTYSRGKTDLMQTHSCKPAKKDEPRNYQDNDTRFLYNADTGLVTSYAFEGFCMQALIAAEVTVFALLECSDHPRQKFIYEAKDQTLRLKEDPSRCVSVSSKTQVAGPWVKRPLLLTQCENTDASLQKWTVVAD